MAIKRKILGYRYESTKDVVEFYVESDYQT